MLRLFKYMIHIAAFDNLAATHNKHIISYLCNHPEIMCDKKHSYVLLRPNPADFSQYLLLNQCQLVKAMRDMNKRPQWPQSLLR